MITAEHIFRGAFPEWRERRSTEYRHGVLDILKLRMGEIQVGTGFSQYQPGTAQLDAYLAGTREGHRLFNNYSEGRKNASTGTH